MQLQNLLVISEGTIRIRLVPQEKPVERVYLTLPKSYGQPLLLCWKEG